jgi:copper chaperone CopZ
VQPITIRSLVGADARKRLPTEEGFRFCPAPDCDTVYSHAASGTTVSTADVSVEVFQKSSRGERPVCYCFDHCVEDVRQDASDGRILADIEDKCNNGLDRCEEMNPRGRCCLVNVRRVMSEMELGPGDSVVVEQVEEHDCCAAQAKTEVPSVKEPNRGRWAAGGAVVAALASSACCWLPLSLIALGVSAGGVGAFFEAYRMWMLGGAAVLLGLGFYFVYFRAPTCEPGDACAVPNPKLTRFNKILLWAATGFVVIFALFPNYVGYLVGGADEPAAHAAAALPAATEPLAAPVTRVYLIEGMSCEGCTSHIKEAVSKVAGVTAVAVVYDDKLARVTFASGSEPNDALILAAIDDTGFEARLAQQPATQKGK